MIAAARCLLAYAQRRAAGTALLAVAMGWAPHASAQQHWHGSVAATTDYVFRGLSQTRGGPALQADLHYEGRSGGFAGAWGSTLDTGYDSIGRLEVDAYAGWSWALASDWAARISYVRYLYPDADKDLDYDYGEFDARLSWRDRAVASVAWAPDLMRFNPEGYAHRGNGWAYELSLRQPLGARFAAIAGGGYYDQLFDVSYWAWNAGVSCVVGPFELDLSRFGNDSTARTLYGHEAAGDRWALTALWRF
jgi:uncharacterized protein (TIGR02001 family)